MSIKNIRNIVNDLVQQMEYLPSGIVKVSYKDDTPCLMFHPNYYDPEFTIEIDLDISVLEHWEKCNIPPIPENHIKAKKDKYCPILEIKE